MKGLKHLTRKLDSRTGTDLQLSVLNQSPVGVGSTPGDALQNSIALARRVYALGYTRFWMSEHHVMDTLPRPAPETMLAPIGGRRSGSGLDRVESYCRTIRL